MKAVITAVMLTESANDNVRESRFFSPFLLKKLAGNQSVHWGSDCCMLGKPGLQLCGHGDDPSRLSGS